MFKEHQGKVKCIEWTDDDSGFVSAGLDGFVIFWKLHPEIFAAHGEKRSGHEKNPQWRYEHKFGKFADLRIKTDSDREVFAVTEDHQIKEITKSKEVFRYEAANAFSQIQAL